MFYIGVSDNVNIFFDIIDKFTFAFSIEFRWKLEFFVPPIQFILSLKLALYKTFSSEKVTNKLFLNSIFEIKKLSKLTIK